MISIVCEVVIVLNCCATGVKYSLEIQESIAILNMISELQTFTDKNRTLSSMINVTPKLTQSISWS